MTTSIATTQEQSQPEIVFDKKQQQAVDLCCDIQQRLVAVTGAAGSGKTTILKAAYNAVVNAGYRVVLCAPTGKAAKRIKEVTGIEAMTIHRLLEYTNPGDPDPKTGKPIEYSYPTRTRNNPIEYDVVFADEYAMVPTEVHRNLLAAIPFGGVLRCFGDDNQLAPIEEDSWRYKKHPNEPDPPSPFQTIMAKFPSVRLDTVYRQGADSGILTNLHSILRGVMPTRNDQWTMEFTDQPVSALKEYCLEALDRGVDFSSPNNQVITVQNKSWIGTINLNQVLQELFQDGSNKYAFVPRNSWVKQKGDTEAMPIKMYIGDKVMITRNMYDLGVMNGETGVIIEITSDDELVIDFGDKEVAIPPSLLVVNRYGKTVEVDPRKDVDLGYAMTTHKTQGSEYENIVYVLNKSGFFMQRRRNFYTAASRGRSHVHIITDQSSMSNSLRKKD